LLTPYKQRKNVKITPENIKIRQKHTKNVLNPYILLGMYFAISRDTKLITELTGRNRQMIATDLLKEDHRRVDRLFKKIKDTPKGEHPALFKQIKAELDVHSHIEEAVFYPVLEAKGDKELKDITREGIEEHRQAKMFLKEIDGMSANNKQFEAKLNVLMEDIEHHVKEEEDEMFPMVEDQFSTAAQEKMAADLKKEKAKFIKTLSADEVAALQASMNAPEEKGVVGTILEKAKEMVGGMFSSPDNEGAKKGPATAKSSSSAGKAAAKAGGNGKSSAAKSNGGARPAAPSAAKKAKAPAAKKTSAKAPASKAGSAKTKSPSSKSKSAAAK
jgi:iron-sulfur cluster repair protein YtfE (RIC family)